MLMTSHCGSSDVGGRLALAFLASFLFIAMIAMHGGGNLWVLSSWTVQNVTVGVGSGAAKAPAIGGGSVSADGLAVGSATIGPTDAHSAGSRVTAATNAELCVPEEAEHSTTTARCAAVTASVPEVAAPAAAWPVMADDPVPLVDISGTTSQVSVSLTALGISRT